MKNRIYKFLLKIILRIAVEEITVLYAPHAISNITLEYKTGGFSQYPARTKIDEFIQFIERINWVKHEETVLDGGQKYMYYHYS